MTNSLETLTWQAPEGIPAAAAVLRRGGLVAFPTETVYGLGADAGNPLAVAAIFSAKDRPSFNPLIVHVASIGAARKLADFNSMAGALANAFWPGPLTLVLPEKPNSGLTTLVSAGLPHVGLRVPAHPVSQALLKAFGGPVAAPSANLSGKISPTTAQHVVDGLWGRIDGILDGGKSQVGLESTIIGFAADGPVLLRAGGLPAEAIEQCLDMQLARHSDARIIAPGQLESHYAPGVSLRLDADNPQPDEAWLGFGPETLAVLSRNLSPGKDLHEAAANLFAFLREIDAAAAKDNISRVAVARIPDIGIGRAINDRLRRAAAPRQGSGPATFL